MVRAAAIASAIIEPLADVLEKVGRGN